MTTVYLHVGMPKCASSTVQGYFNKNDNRNRKAGFVYPVAGRSTGGYFNHEPIVHMDKDEIAQLVATVKEEAAGAETVFISAEAFVNAYWDQPVTATLIEQLNATFGASNVRLLFLFRNHFSFIESAFAQFLKGGLYRVNHGKFYRKTDRGIESYCKSFQEANGFDFFDYARVIEEFRKHCEPENRIEVMSIERADLETGDILDELCKKFDLVPPTGKKVKNARFPVKALLGLAYAIEQHSFRSVRPMRKGVASRFADSVDGYSSILHIHGDLAQRVAERQRADAAYFKTELGCDFPSLFEPRLEPPFPVDPDNEVVLSGEERAWLDGYFSALEKQ
ncbi:MAG: hypothetical protein KDK53_17915 [Maritimibacter sp.]|nr:hypothetical protein [Maritimibacter sp.]